MDQKEERLRLDKITYRKEGEISSADTAGFSNTHVPWHMCVRILYPQARTLVFSQR